MSNSKTSWSNDEVDNVPDAARFFGRDDRIQLASKQFPWSSIGLITLSSGGYCSAALVDSRIVVSAAHCLFDRKRNFEPQDPIKFVLPHASIESDVTASLIPPGFDPIRHQNSKDIDGLDWALIVIRDPIGTELGHFTVLPRLADIPLKSLQDWQTKGFVLVNQGGYSIDRPAGLSAHISCAIQSKTPNGLLRHSCDTFVGDSGSPLFMIANKKVAYLLAIESSRIENLDGSAHNLGVSIEQFQPALQKLRETLIHKSTTREKFFGF